MNRDDNTRLYRRFGWARNRLLLCKQDRVAELHNELRSMDKVDEREHPEKLWSRRHGQDSKDDSPRSRVLDRLEVELEEYDALLLREHAIASISSPTKQNHRAIFDWVHNNKPVVPEEYQYLYEDGDFVLVGNQQDDWLHSIQERIWSLSQHGFFRVSYQTLMLKTLDLPKSFTEHLVVQIMLFTNTVERSSQDFCIVSDDSFTDAANHPSLFSRYKCWYQACHTRPVRLGFLDSTVGHDETKEA